jgi:type II secretory pathway component PulF
MPSLKARSQFYVTLATLDEAGVPRVRALQTGMPRGFAGAARRIAEALRVEGITMSEAMSHLPSLFSRFECNLVAVGEATGRFDTVCHSLAQWFTFVGAVRSKVISALLYPIVVYHAAAVLVPFISVILGKCTDQRAMLQGGAMIALPWVLLLCWCFFGGLLMALPGVADLLLALPFVGGVIYRLDCARFFQAYSMGLNSGLGMFETVDLGAGACRNPAMARRFRRVAAIMRAEGSTFAQAFVAHPSARDRSSMIPAMMQTGENTGRSAEMAERIARVSREEAETSIERAAHIGPTLLYLCLALYIGYQIIQFYGQLYSNVNQLLNE